MTRAIEVTDLSAEYKTSAGPVMALDGVSLVLEEGASAGIVGESGSGKSTLGLSFGRLLPASAKVAGTAMVFGRDVFALTAGELAELRRTVISFVFQNPDSVLDPTRRIGKQVTEAIELVGASATTSSLLEQVGLKDIARVEGAFPHQLSGGMAQRAAIAMAIAGNPRLIVGDEPTASLDSTVRRHVMDLLSTLATEAGSNLLLLSHDLRSVRRHCEYVFVMYAGRIVESGRSDAVFSSPSPVHSSSTGRRSRRGGARSSTRRHPWAPSAVAGSRHGMFVRPEVPLGDREVQIHSSDDGSGRGPRGCMSADRGDYGRQEQRLMNTVVELDDVTVRFKSGSLRHREMLTAVDSVSLAIDAGRTLGLAGESGSGKTTVGRVCLGLIRPDLGRVRFLGEPLESRRHLRAGQMQVVLQRPEWALNPHLRVATSLSEPLRILKHSRSVAERAVRPSLEEVGLDPSLANRFPHQLSGGQRQRVAIARALITKPRLLVLDEVVSALDVSVQAQVLNLIKDLQAEHGFAALFISHDLAAVRYVSHQVGVMREAKLLELASVETFYHRPEHPYSRELLAAIES